MTRRSLAIIGTGIAGMACGHRLHPHYDLTFYERNSYVGGHTNTVTVDEEGVEIPIDTGFMVYNEVTYPNLTELFRELDVPTKPTSMTFSVQHVPTGLEFCGSGISGLFAQRRNLLRPSFLRLLNQIDRFNRESITILDHSESLSLTLGDYAKIHGYDADFLNKYLIPMSSAVWSTPPDRMLAFPAVTLIRFFHNHGFLGLHTQHPWRTVTGGSRTYRDKLIEPFRDRIHTNRAVLAVRRTEDRVEVADAAGTKSQYDAVIFACHADEALALLTDPTGLESELLRRFRYQYNSATLHTDESVMPKNRRAWSSWNYRTENDASGSPVSSTIYWMNSLQQVSQKKNYFVSINDPGRVREEHILKQIDYHHPLFSVEAMFAQEHLRRLNTNGRTFYCGSYFRYGFHEDALTSAWHCSDAVLSSRMNTRELAGASR